MVEVAAVDAVQAEAGEKAEMARMMARPSGVIQARAEWGEEESRASEKGIVQGVAFLVCSTLPAAAVGLSGSLCRARLSVPHPSGRTSLGTVWCRCRQPEVVLRCSGNTFEKSK